ncbi:hypothetical protein CRM22_009625 [Opisthorchis felineus]|uniref:Uncharacterized protein n=1 Tax=Opisthorchis felineus TaxID=147828 RepID=A0A4S2L6U5_OPIFE|nr:hypothetical protein CRM22_009625 [Opisthorchis felineus]
MLLDGRNTSPTNHTTVSLGARTLVTPYWFRPSVILTIPNVFTSLDHFNEDVRYGAPVTHPVVYIFSDARPSFTTSYSSVQLIACKHTPDYHCYENILTLLKLCFSSEVLVILNHPSCSVCFPDYPFHGHYLVVRTAGTLSASVPLVTNSLSSRNQ